MIKPFITENFLLPTSTAQKLYFDYAAELPIIDYHNHLSPQIVSENINFKNITNAWLDGDHYKWRAMRAFGIEEAYITGTKTDALKFEKWADTVPYTVRNPLFHWSNLELHRYFGINEVLQPQNQQAIFGHCNELLSQEDFNISSLLSKMNVETICTTDHPTDSLEHHKKLQQNTQTVLTVLPSFRPDKFLQIENVDFKTHIETLAEVCRQEIITYQDLLQCLKLRAYDFDLLGCKSADHGLEYMPNEMSTEKEIDDTLKYAIQGKNITSTEAEKFRTRLLYDLCLVYHELSWVQQFHLGAIRNNNGRKFAEMGPDSGWDAIGDWPQSKNLSQFLNKLDATDQLSKTVIYNLNPADNEMMAAMIGNFNDGSIKGKIQYGAAWWFLDQKNGIKKQLDAISNMGLVSQFIGMLTDSRSFLSFPRHEYFRRILCSVFAQEMDNHELPNDAAFIGSIIQDICYNNVKKYFNL